MNRIPLSHPLRLDITKKSAREYFSSTISLDKSRPDEIVSVFSRESHLLQVMMESVVMTTTLKMAIRGGHCYLLKERVRRVFINIYS